MGSNFLQQFMAGWQMGQQRNQLSRQDQEMQMAMQQQQEETARRRELLKLQQQEAKLALQRHNFESAQAEAALRQQAAGLNRPVDVTGADRGLQEQAPDMGGPPVSQISVTPPERQMMPITGPATGETIQYPILSGVEQEAMRRQQAEEEAHQKIAAIFGQESARSRARAPYEEAKSEREHALRMKEIGARVAGARSVAGGAGKASEAERTKAEVAKYALGQMPQWQTFIRQNEGAFGPIAGKMTDIKQSGWGRLVGVKPDPKIAEAKAQWAIMTNAMINSLSGAAVSPQEFERLRKQVPEFTDDPVTINAKMAVLDSFFKFRLANMNQPWTGGGWEGGAAPDTTAERLVIDGVELIQEE